MVDVFSEDGKLESFEALFRHLWSARVLCVCAKAPSFDKSRAIARRPTRILNFFSTGRKEKSIDPSRNARMPECIAKIPTEI